MGKIVFKLGFWRRFFEDVVFKFKCKGVKERSIIVRKKNIVFEDFDLRKSWVCLGN